MNVRYDHVLIGGGVASLIAAETIRGRDADASIAIIGSETHATYSRVLLPHVTRGKVPEEKTFLRPEGSFASRGIDFFPGRTAVSVDTATKTVRLDDGVAVEYGSLLIASGTRVRRLRCPGADEAQCVHLQTLEDARAVADAATKGSAIVYGAGFIALELLMTFVQKGCATTAAFRGDGFFGRILDAESRALLDDAVTRAGVTLMPRVEIRAFERVAGGMTRAHLSNGGPIDAAVVGVGIGVEPNIEFLAGSGIATNVGVRADASTRTSVPNVFAAGDVAEADDPIAGTSRLVGNWQNAMFQGKIAGTNMAGGDMRQTVVTTYSITCFGLPVAVLGAAELPPDMRAVRRSSETNASLQFVMRDGMVAGATCVGPFPERAAVSALIASRARLGEKEIAALSDRRTDISALVP